MLDKTCGHKISGHEKVNVDFYLFFHPCFFAFPVFWQKTPETFGDFDESTHWTPHDEPKHEMLTSLATLAI